MSLTICKFVGVRGTDRHSSIERGEAMRDIKLGRFADLDEPRSPRPNVLAVYTKLSPDLEHVRSHLRYFGGWLTSRLDRLMRADDCSGRI